MTTYDFNQVMLIELGYTKCSNIRWFVRFKNEQKAKFWNSGKLTKQGRQYCFYKSFNKKKANGIDSGVYIIRYPFGVQKIKIGWSNSVHTRFKQYNTVFCGQQELLIHIITQDKSIEKEIFQVAIDNGLVQNAHYEVFDYLNEEQLLKFIDKCQQNKYQ